MLRLSVQEPERALGQLQAGRSVWDVVATFGCHLATIYRLETRHHLIGAVNDRPRSGRPRVKSQRQDHHNRFVHLREPSRPATVTTRETAGTHNNRISGSALRRCFIIQDWEHESRISVLSWADVIDETVCDGVSNIAPELICIDPSNSYKVLITLGMDPWNRKAYSGINRIKNYYEIFAFLLTPSIYIYIHTHTSQKNILLDNS